MTGRGLRRYLDDLLRGRRPRPFRATPADAGELRVAIALRATRPAADEPREGFVDELHRRLAADHSVPEPAAPEPRTGAVRRRRLLLQGAALAAASAAIGAVVDRAVVDRTAADRGDAGPATLTPTNGTWQTVSASADLPEGAVRAFDLGTVVGFVQRVDGAVRAVSGTCTHQGCRLSLDAATGDLNCPCHTTVFALSGELIQHQLPLAPRPLPTFAAREIDGAVQVYAPPLTI